MLTHLKCVIERQDPALLLGATWKDQIEWKQKVLLALTWTPINHLPLRIDSVAVVESERRHVKRHELFVEIVMEKLVERCYKWASLVAEDPPSWKPVGGKASQGTIPPQGGVAETKLKTKN